MHLTYRAPTDRNPATGRRPPDDAVEAAAKRLHCIMEKLDPTEEPAWDDLRDFQRQFYKCCVKDLSGSTEFIALVKDPTMT
jgi:hypothetical protein